MMSTASPSLRVRAGLLAAAAMGQLVMCGAVGTAKKVAGHHHHHRTSSSSVDTTAPVAPTAA
eukprot:545917-Pelagomonas_calceolata.AAC.5